MNNNNDEILKPKINIVVKDINLKEIFFLNNHPLENFGIKNLPNNLVSELNINFQHYDTFKLYLIFPFSSGEIEIEAILLKIESFQQNNNLFEWYFYFNLTPDKKRELNTAISIFHKKATLNNLTVNNLLKSQKIKRKYIRNEISFDLYINILNIKYHVYLENISLGGFAFKNSIANFDLPLIVGNIYNFYFIYQEKNYYFKARVVAKREYLKNLNQHNELYFKYSMRFYKVNEETKVFLKRIIALSENSNVKLFKKK